MKNRAILSLVTAGLFATLLGGCEKSDVSTTYNIHPRLDGFDSVRVDSAMLSDSLRAFIYYADTADLKFGTLTETLEGKLYTKGGAPVNPDLTASAGADTTLVIGPVVREKFVVMCCHTNPAYGVYAWKNGATGESLPSINVNILFRLWETKDEYKDNGWEIHYTNPAPTPAPAP